MFYTKISLAVMLCTITTGTTGQLIEIEDGHVGLWYNTGVLHSEPLMPGWHVYLPFKSRIEKIETRDQTDTFHNIHCTTQEPSGTLELIYPEVTVSNRLMPEHAVDVVKRYGKNYDDKLIKLIIEDTIRTTCKSKTLDQLIRTETSTINEALEEGLREHQRKEGSNLIIRKVTLKDPVYSEHIRKNHHDTAEQITRQKKVEEEKKLALMEEDKKREVEEREALRQKSVSEIHYQRKINEENSQAQLRKIEADSEATQKRIASEAEAFRINTLAEANMKKFTPEYLKWHWQENVLKNADAYWGKDLPQHVMMKLPDGTTPAAETIAMNRATSDV